MSGRVGTLCWIPKSLKWIFIQRLSMFAIKEEWEIPKSRIMNMICPSPSWPFSKVQTSLTMWQCLLNDIHLPKDSKCRSRMWAFGRSMGIFGNTTTFGHVKPHITMRTSHSTSGTTWKTVYLMNFGWVTPIYGHLRVLCQLFWITMPPWNLIALHFSINGWLSIGWWRHQICTLPQTNMMTWKEGLNFEHVFFLQNCIFSGENC